MNGDQPAFPTAPVPQINPITGLTIYVKEGTAGMSLREYYAGCALQGIRVGDWAEVQDGAKYCADYADAILAELEKKK